MTGHNQASVCIFKRKHLQRIEQEVCANCWVQLLLGLPCQPHIQVARAPSAAGAADDDMPPVPVSELLAPCASLALVMAYEAFGSGVGRWKQKQKSVMWLRCAITR